MQDQELKILLIDDDPDEAFLIREILAEVREPITTDLEQTSKLEWADRLSTGLEYLSTRAFDIVLLDLTLPDSQGLETFQTVQKHVPHLPIIVLTGLNDRELSIQAVRAGAQDYISKDYVDTQVLLRAIRYAIERKQSEQKLQESRSRLRKILEYAPSAIIIINKVGEILFANAQSEYMFGYKKKELTGKSIEILLPEHLRSKHIQHRLNFTQNPSSRPMGTGLELTARHKNGHEFSVEIGLSPMEIEDDTLITAIIQDITQRVEAQKALRQSNRNLKLANLVARRLSAILDVDQLLAKVVKLVQDFLNCYHVSIALLEEDELVFRAISGGMQHISPGARLQVGKEGIENWIKLYKQASQTTQGESKTSNKDTIPQYTELIVPVKLGERTLGVLNAESDQDQLFDETDERLLQAIADQLALALDNARLFQEVQEQRDEADALTEVLFEQSDQMVAINRVTTSLLAVTNLDEAAQVLMGGLEEQMNVNKGMFWLAEEKKLRLAVVKGLPSQVSLDISPHSWPALDHVWHTGQPETQSNFLADEGAKSPYDQYFDEWFMLPVRDYNEVLGILITERGAIDEDTLRIFINQTALGMVAARSYGQLRAEKKRSDTLLRVILPDPVAEELQTTNQVKPRRYENVAVIFSDVVEFTSYCDQHEPEEVLAHLQDMVEGFEELALRYDLQKIKTSGDSFMATAGLLKEVKNPVLNCVKCGLDMLALTQDLPSQWVVRVGIHVGPVIAGVVGHRQYLFDVWGDTVNTASRVEGQGLPGKVVVSASAWQQISNQCWGESLGLIEVKGKGAIELFRVIKCKA